MQVRLTEGAPDELDTGDWDAVCKTPSIEGFFHSLFREVVKRPMPDLGDVKEDADDEVRVRTGLYGDRTFGAEVRAVEILESSDFAVRYRWETYGLSGMKVIWEYYLEKAGQLGHVAFRQGRLECEFEDEASRDRFAELWQKTFAKVPTFEQVRA